MTDRNLTAQYDVAGMSVWEALANICLELPVDDDRMIVSARHAGDAPNGCGVLEVTFGNLDIAKGFTAVYLQAADADDSDVLEYLGIPEPELVPA